MKANTILLNLFWFIAVLSISTQVAYSQDVIVDSSYCSKLIIDSTNDLQERVNHREMSVQRANEVLELVELKCKEAIKDHLNVSQFEELFKTSTSNDCNGLGQQIYPLMKGKGYDAEYTMEIIETVEEKCRNNVANKGTRLGLLLEIRKYLSSHKIEIIPNGKD